jgi:DNA processing protein
MDLQNAVALSVIPGISRARAATIFKALDAERQGAVSLEDVIAQCGRSADVARLATAARHVATALLEQAADREIAAISWDDERYPGLLRTIADAPPVLWLRGDAAVLNRPAVAIVGSRAASAYALEVAGRLAADLARRGIVVVSGLARGVDGAAHRGAVRGGGPTVAVLGSGPDVIYPREHAELAVSLCENGALLSELGPGAPPLAEHFPQRNRLISGISLGLVVVEASDRSGSLITARCALEQGRDVMAVPGSVLGGRNRGSHALLKDGAKVIETADDILEELGWGSCQAPPQISGNSLQDSDLLSTLTPGETYGLEELSATVGVSGSELLPRLTEWEIQGRLVKLGSLWQRRS